MSKLRITCESCGTEYEVDEKLAGSSFTCSNCKALIHIPFPDMLKGTAIGGFILEKQLGAGSMGEVWLAHQKTMDRKVALKLLSREFTHDPNFVERFLKEVKISAKMDHPNMITAFDAGSDNDIYYLATSFVDGNTLEEKLQASKRGFFVEGEALSIMLDISAALCYAWNEFRVIHRDLKPANIMINNKGVGKLLDLGISKSIDGKASLTLPGTIVGTPYYISPEQGKGEMNLDFHTDIYSLGATLYHLVTGMVPFNADSLVEIISRHITDPLPPARGRNPEVSDKCSALIDTMMAKTPSDRQDSWEAVIEDMELVLAGKAAPSSKHLDSHGSLVMRLAPLPSDSSEEEKKITWKTTEKL